MKEPERPSLHGWTPPFGQNTFPGIENTFAGPPEVINPTVIPAPLATVNKGGLPFSLTNLNDLKGMVDRMGGIEGVLSTVGKFQKIMASMQQMAPMLKLFMGKGATAATANARKNGSRPKRSAARRPTSKTRTKRTTKKR